MDRENVMQALDLCSNALYCADPNSRCGQCPYRTKDMTGTNEMNCSDVLMADALALLKEQGKALYELGQLLKERAEETERLKTPTAGDNHIPLRW